MKKLLLISLFLSLVIGCSHSNDGDSSNNFAGTWKGTYSGTDNGTWNATIDSNGKASGSAHSTTYNQDFSINGNVDNSGNLNAVLGTSSDGGTFKGTLSGNSGSGTWTNNVGTPHSGNWSGNKQ